MLTVDVIATRLETTPRTIQRWILEGYFPNAYKINPYRKNSAYRVPESDVVTFEEKRRTSLPRQTHKE